MKRNLAYFVTPIKSNSEWKRNIDSISRRISVFNNKIIFAIADNDSRMEEASVVKKYINKKIKKVKVVRFLNVSNVQRLGEVIPFYMMSSHLRSEDPEEATFYAHAKGVSPKYFEIGNERALRNKRVWRNLMYHFNLRDENKIDEAMRSYVSAGCIKRNVKMLSGTSAEWHYAGNFFWYNHEKFYSREDWNKFRLVRYGVECYMGENFDKETGCCLFGEDMPFLIAEYDDQMWESYLSKYGLTLNQVLNDCII